MATAKTRITALKKQLKARARKKGLYENFGQSEVRKVKDQFGFNSLCINDMCLSKDQIKTRKQIEAFNEWAMNFSDRDLN